MIRRDSPEQKAKAKIVKFLHRKMLMRIYGSNWRKHLNAPEKKLLTPIKLSF